MKAIPMEPPNRFTFAWWNLHEFAHYDAAQSALKRRPKLRSHYEAKRDRILAVIQEFLKGKFPDIIAVCEITRAASLDLVTRLSPGFDVAVAPAYPDEDDFQVAVFYRTGIGLTPEFPLLPSETEDVTRETRPM